MTLTPEDQKDYDREQLKALYSHRSFLIQEQLKSSGSFDKYLLSFATSSLYLSIFFVKDLATTHNRPLLIAGWVMLLVSILLILISFLLSERAFEQEIDETDKGIEDSEYDRVSQNSWTIFITVLQIGSLVTFVAGLACFVTFYFINIA